MTEQVLPQITLTGSGADLDPAQVLAHALTIYRAGVRAEAEKRVLAGPMDLGADILSSILMEVAGGHLNLFRITAGVAFRTTIRQAARRQQLALSEMEAAQQADDAAMNLGAYLAATSGNAVMDGYHRAVNLKVPPKEAARRAVRAFGLTVPQMRTAAKIADEPVTSSEPGAWHSLVDRFIERAFGARVKVIVENSLRQAENDAVQRGWEQGVAEGTIPETALKAWFTAHDERVCPICGPMDKKSVPVGDTFVLPDGNRVKNPPAPHVNCRCSVELIYAPEEIAKAEWDPRLHPRSTNGEFGTKTKVREPEVDPEALATVNRMLVDVGPQVRHLRTDTLRLAPPIQVAKPLQIAKPIEVAHIEVAKPLQVAGVETAAPVQTAHVTLGGKPFSLKALSLDFQTKVARSLNDNEQGSHPDTRPELPPDWALSPMPPEMLAYATMAQMNGLDADTDSGKIHLERPLRFVDSTERSSVNGAVNLALEPLSDHLRNHGTYATLEDVENHEDPGVRALGKRLRAEVGPRGGFVVSIEPEDVIEAFRSKFLPSRYSKTEEYRVTAVGPESSLGESYTVPDANAEAVMALATNQSHKVEQLLPKVVMAPYGTWEDQTQVMSSASGDRDVTGPFDWKRRSQGGVIQITPDPDVYRRANPEF